MLREHLLRAREGAGEGVLAARALARAQGAEPEPHHRRRRLRREPRRRRALEARAVRRHRVRPADAAPLAGAVAHVRAGKSRVVDVSFPEIEKFDKIPQPTSSECTAFLSVMEGCSKACSYCIVPTTRGKEISRPLDDVLAEARRLAELGAREITLLGQNVNAYRGAVQRRRQESRPRGADPPASRRSTASSASVSRRRIRRSSRSRSSTRMRASTSSRASCTCRCRAAPTAC